MTKQQFEEVYFEAREVLYRRGSDVGKPIISEDGVRRCPVNGASLIDRELLRQAWGDRLTDEILADLTESEMVPACCAKFERLWDAYTLATRRYLRAFADQQVSRDPFKQPFLALVLAVTSQTRSQLRQALRLHSLAHRNDAA